MGRGEFAQGGGCGDLVSGPEGVCQAGGVLIVVGCWMMLLKSIDFFESRLSEAIPSQMLRSLF